MVDNFNLIADFLEFGKTSEFYYLQILQRKKDFPAGTKRLGKNNSSRLIKYYTIRSSKELINTKEEIIQLCELFKARAMINLNRRDDVRILHEMNLSIAQNMKSNHFHIGSKLFTSCCGEKLSTDKLRLIDIDYKEEGEYIENILINEIKPIGSEKIKLKVPTKSGYHLITSKFHREDFEEKLKLAGFNDVDIHDNNPTILYIPESIK